MLRRTPMTRRNAPEARAAQREAEKAANLVALCIPARTLHTARMGRCDSVAAPVPKAEKAKPGKRAPTVAERAWMDWIVAHGCIACQRDGLGHRAAAVHHILRGGQRMGHLHTLPLCDPGHHQGGQPLGMVSRHPWKAQFETRYGTEHELLAELQLAYAIEKRKPV